MAEKFVVVVGWGCGVVEHVATMYNSNEVALELIYVGFWQKFSKKRIYGKNRMYPVQ